MVTNVYFIRHAQSDYTIKEDNIRPLTTKGLEDTEKITETLKDKKITKIYSSPYLRTIDTVKDLTEKLKLDILVIEDFYERRVGEWVENFYEYARRQWEDFNYKLENGESLREVQERNISALHSVLKESNGMNIVIRTHGTALSTIINYYDTDFQFDSFCNHR
jgi:2,3-bisphosphoglycerate-dependent phosphoglycerate mutase